MFKPSLNWSARLVHERIIAVVLAVMPVMLQAQPAELFTLLKPKDTGVRFTNAVPENDSVHVLNYEYLYNGHGIGVGDFNNDGLDDLFISGNAVPHKLFLHQGDLSFKDVTRQAGVGGNRTWGTGVSIADVNGDGWLDIYVCHSGKFPPGQLANELFINTGVRKGVPRFREAAKEYGLDAPGSQSTHAAFFDYDRDGDLDMFLLNHSVHSFYPFLNTRAQRSTPDMRYGNRLFRNDSHDGAPVFTDVTLEAGIINNALNYGLSVNISDVNGDGWPDIYTTSDYSEHDCFYVNRGDGTFSQELQRAFPYVSKYSMGADIADYNNDGLPDVLTLDMLPEDNYRQKLLKGPDQYDQYHLLVDSGYYRQHMRNMLHLNRGQDAQGHVRFSEIGQLAGVSNTDWSWAPLLADFDGDGWKDLLVTNGYLRDFTDMDFLKYTMPDAQLRAAMDGTADFKTYELVQQMPSNKLRNYVFRNNGDLTFSDVSVAWGLNDLAVSNAAVYADFDQDGDLDLVIGNNNEPVMVYRNNLNPGGDWFGVRVEGAPPNTFALGAKVNVYARGSVQYQEIYPVRGFQSSVTTRLLFYVPSGAVDSVVVAWPSGKRKVITEIPSGETLTVREAEATSAPRVAEVNAQTPFIHRDAVPDYRHRENSFVDFQAEVLVPYQLSRMGPALAAADVNGDGLDDLFVGGAVGQAGVLWLQTTDGRFDPSASRPWNAHRMSEDVNAVFFDADNDGDADLYVVSGGNEYEDGAVEYQDRLYLNDGRGQFVSAAGALPAMRSSKLAVAVGDMDGDGDLDLVVGGRGKPGYFPYPSASHLLRNDSRDGKVVFEDVTDVVAPELRNAGMVGAAAWDDLDGDRVPELIVGGDWMPVRIFRSSNGKLTEVAAMKEMYGQWSAIRVMDIDGDGDRDIVMGNVGQNHQYKASPEEPVTIHVSDFDGNGALDPILCYYIQGRSYPMASRDQLLDQIPSLKKKFIRYSDYADATLADIFTEEQLAHALVLPCTELRTLVLRNDGDMQFSAHPLPLEAQFSRTSAILAGDYDGDGVSDLVLLGNFGPYRPELGENEASLGLFLRGRGQGRFDAVPSYASGLFVGGDVRHAVEIKTARGRSLVVAENDGPLQIIDVASHDED